MTVEAKIKKAFEYIENQKKALSAEYTRRFDNVSVNEWGEASGDEIVKINEWYDSQLELINARFASMIR